MVLARFLVGLAIGARGVGSHTHFVINENQDIYYFPKEVILPSPKLVTNDPAYFHSSQLICGIARDAAFMLLAYTQYFWGLV